jgi:hypothetical protein
MARKKTATKQTEIAKKLVSSNARLDISKCVKGRCVYIFTRQGWECFAACGPNPKCKCAYTPELPSPIGTSFLVICEELGEDPRKDGMPVKEDPIRSEGFVTFRSEFIINPDYSEDYCVAISESPGKWRYFYLGEKSDKDQDKGYLDAVSLERGVIRLDRLNPDGTESIMLGAIGLLEPDFE